MGTPASPNRQNGVQACSSSPPHCCRSCGTRAEVPLLRMRPWDAWTCRNGENGGNSYPRLHPRQLLPHFGLHRSSALLRGLSLQVLRRHALRRCRALVCWEPFMFARLLAPVTPESTLATSASRAWNGWRLTWKTHHDRRVQDLPGAKLLPERLGRLQAAGGGALHRHAHHGLGEVLHPHRDLHARASVRRKP